MPYKEISSKDIVAPVSARSRLPSLWGLDPELINALTQRKLEAEQSLRADDVFGSNVRQKIASMIQQEQEAKNLNAYRQEQLGVQRGQLAEQKRWHGIQDANTDASLEETIRWHNMQDKLKRDQLNKPLKNENTLADILSQQHIAENAMKAFRGGFTRDSYGANLGAEPAAMQGVADVLKPTGMTVLQIQVIKPITLDKGSHVPGLGWSVPFSGSSISPMKKPFYIPIPIAIARKPNELADWIERHGEEAKKVGQFTNVEPELLAKMIRSQKDKIGTHFKLYTMHTQ